ncbi:hypothetical protein NQ318_019716 [Aromia moschata]|uniref:Uncharacterized protein n=1 Tax=Aromia moschata TaxID=1265417 RepID=A0AAV8Z6U0_9CUCU|nr:hypothetical protein NQ318_019716 [Aromia moschata]
MSFKKCYAFISLLFLTWISNSHQFYVPGMAPTDFKKGDLIEVKAVKMTSIHTQLPSRVLFAAFLSTERRLGRNTL